MPLHHALASQLTFAALLGSLFCNLSCTPAGETTPPPAPAPAPSPALECEVVLKAHAVETGARVARLVVTAENVGSTSITLELPDRCPNGPVDFDGLGPGYDYYGTCNAGACPGPRAPIRVDLAPRRAQTIAETEIHFDGRAPCTGPLEPGRASVVPLAPDLGVRVCVVRAEFEIPPTPSTPAEPAPTTRREPPPEREPAPTTPRPRREPPKPTKARADDPYACQEPQDCVLACPSVPGCCGFPCGCNHAIHRDHLEAYTARYAKTCDRPPCPAVACRYEDAVGVTCRNGRCQASMTLTGF